MKALRIFRTNEERCVFVSIKYIIKIINNIAGFAVVEVNNSELSLKSLKWRIIYL